MCEFSSHSLLLPGACRIVGAIDEGKVRYDEMYYLQGLYERFSVYDRQNVPELIDTGSVLVTEGPILLYDPETGSSKLRYLILLSHMVICVKERKNTFAFNWKVDLYRCIIRYEETGGRMTAFSFLSFSSLSLRVLQILTAWLFCS